MTARLVRRDNRHGTHVDAVAVHGAGRRGDLLVRGVVMVTVVVVAVLVITVLVIMVIVLGDRRVVVLLGNLNTVGLSPGQLFCVRKAAALSPTLLSAVTTALMVLARERS